MYQYDDYDKTLVKERARQFRDQVARRLSGELTEAEFRSLRLMNGLYLQLHAYMLRIAVPYGLLSTAQLRQLAYIARKYDKGYGHFTTRQNLQLNWVQLKDIPDILDDLASVEMHAIQTSGNCIRNITSDPFAGVAEDEIEDPRPYCEIMRQWSTFHPEFAYLPRKFKFAVTGATHDRAAIAYHDIGFKLVRNDAGVVGFQILVGGGMGRTPMLAKLVRPWLEKSQLLNYVQAIMRVYNQFGRRDNLYKARIKILVHELGVDEFRRRVEEEFEQNQEHGLILEQAEIDRMSEFFAAPPYAADARDTSGFEAAYAADQDFVNWVERNVTSHKVAGYAVVTVSLKQAGRTPGDATSEQMEAVADLADRYSFGQVRITHRQNLVLADVRKDDLEAVWRELQGLGFASPNINTFGDMICCPGLDYCNLANARSIPIAQQLAKDFEDLDFLYDLGDLKVNISGCINACGHHHAGNIGVLGVDKKGVEMYQLTLGGSSEEDASIGAIIGPAVTSETVPVAVGRILRVYLDARESREESFLATYRRIGMKPFKERVYADN